MIKGLGLTKTFKGSNKEISALTNVNIHIAKGDIFGIIGMSGAGKSTLLRMLCLLEKPTKGSLSVLGKSTEHLKGKELLAARRNIGVVFQGYNLLMQRTVFENIAFPLRLSGTKKDDVTKRVTELLEIVGLSDKANEYPSHLSGGQKQRVAIARALSSAPEILLCDEPTSALDPLSTKNILNLLKKINSELNVTVVIVTHEMGVIKNICTRVAVLEDSKIVEEGDKSSIVNSPSHFSTKLLLGLEA